MAIPQVFTNHALLSVQMIQLLPFNITFYTAIHHEAGELSRLRRYSKS